MLLFLPSPPIAHDAGFLTFFSSLRLGLQTLPTSGSLNSHSVWSEARPTRKSRAVDALKKTNNSVVVIVTIARLFWSERKIEKARDWFARSVAAEGDYGDAWAWWYRFEKNHGTPVRCDYPLLSAFLFRRRKLTFPTIILCGCRRI